MVKEESLTVCEQENAMIKLPLGIMTLAAVCWVAQRIKNRDWENRVERPENNSWRHEGLLSGCGPVKGEGRWLIVIQRKVRRRSQ